MTHGYWVGLMVFKNGCKKSKNRSKMRLKLYQVPCLQQITVIYLMENYLKLFLGFVKHRLSLFENVGRFTVCEHTPVMPGTGTLDSICTVCTVPSMTRPTSDAPSDAPSVLLVPGGGAWSWCSPDWRRFHLLSAPHLWLSPSICLRCQSCSYLILLWLLINKFTHSWHSQNQRARFGAELCFLYSKH